MGPCAAPRRGFASVVVTLCLGGGNLLTRVEAVLPTASLRLTNGGRVYASAAWFGLQIPEEEDATFLPLRVPSGDADGCEGVSVDDAPSGGFVLLVERGNCFFDVKALAAQEAGAKGLVVMNSLEGKRQRVLNSVVAYGGWVGGRVDIFGIASIWCSIMRPQREINLRRNFIPRYLFLRSSVPTQVFPVHSRLCNDSGGHKARKNGETNNGNNVEGADVST